MKYSFIVDNHPKFHLQAYYLLTTLTKLGNVPSDQIIVHYAGQIPENFRKIISEQFATEIRQVERSIHPYCNKIQQLKTFLDTDEDVILLDCDTVVTRPVLWPNIEAVAAKRVDTATPPRSVMTQLFNAAGLALDWVQSDCLPGHEGRETPVNNYNGGVYFFKAGIVQTVYEKWKKWADFCLKNINLLGNYSIHADQAAFALSMTELKIPVHVLNREFNFPTHLNLSMEYDCLPYILHYHWMLDDQQFLKYSGLPNVDSAIVQVNNCISDDRRANFNNQIFWDFRYSNDAEKGSGVGSRGIILEVKYNLLQRLLDAGNYKSVLDIGCGDLETTRRLKGDFNYLGVDTSVEALKLACKKRNDWNFQEYSTFVVNAKPESFNLVLCLDVLIHQSSKADYDRVIQLISNSTNDTLVVAGYDESPVFTSSLTYYYEEISKTIKKTGIFSEVFTVGRYRDVSVIVAKKSPAKPHSRDMSAEHVNDVVGWTRSPMIFRELLDFSRKTVRFFPNHTPRAIEYTWVINELSAMHKQQIILDVGAGVSCLPIFLAAKGNEVITVDQSPYFRKLEQREQWNEWGFLDYSQFDSRIKSINAPFEEAVINKKVDIVYSVSVIEHLLTVNRRLWLKRMHALLNPGGRILLTVDLMPPGDDLWIFAEGKVVEANHGTFRTLYEEIREEGFCVDYVQILQAIPATRVDIALISARLQ